MTSQDKDGFKPVMTLAQSIETEEIITREVRELRRQEVENKRMANELRLEIGRCLSAVPDPGSRGCHITGLSPTARRTAARLASEYEEICNDPVLAVELPENHMDGDLHHLSRALSDARRKGEDNRSFATMIEGIGILDLFSREDTDDEDDQAADAGEAPTM